MNKVESLLHPEYYELEMGLSGTGFETITWPISATANPLTGTSIRDVIAVFVAGLELDKEENRLSQRYLKVRGIDGFIQWASRRIQSTNPNIESCDLPSPFQLNDSE